tara:strand:+ start:4143 stop:4559 length:417 start_codon:yes stop_codon:yes gene_type:complete
MITGISLFVIGLIFIVIAYLIGNNLTYNMSVMAKTGKKVCAPETYSGPSAGPSAGPQVGPRECINTYTFKIDDVEYTGFMDTDKGDVLENDSIRILYNSEDPNVNTYDVDNNSIILYGMGGGFMASSILTLVIGLLIK